MAEAHPARPSQEKLRAYLQHLSNELDYDGWSWNPAALQEAFDVEIREQAPSAAPWLETKYWDEMKDWLENTYLVKIKVARWAPVGAHREDQHFEVNRKRICEFLARPGHDDEESTPSS